MKFLTNAKIKPKGGLYRRSVEVWHNSRGGTHSPTSYFLKYRGRWISPYEQKLKGWDIFPYILNWTLKSIYSSECLKDLVYKENPFLKLVTKDNEWSGAYVPVPIVYASNSNTSKDGDDTA